MVLSYQLQLFTTNYWHKQDVAIPSVSIVIYHCSPIEDKLKDMKREPEDLQTKVKLCVVTTIIVMVIVGVWGILINFIVSFHQPEVS